MSVYSLQRARGRRAEGSLPSHPTAGITHTHMQPGRGTDPGSQEPASQAQGGCTWKPQKITECGVTVIAAEVKTTGRESQDTVLS